MSSKIHVSTAGENPQVLASTHHNFGARGRAIPELFPSRPWDCFLPGEAAPDPRRREYLPQLERDFAPSMPISSFSAPPDTTGTSAATCRNSATPPRSPLRNRVPHNPGEASASPSAGAGLLRFEYPAPRYLKRKPTAKGGELQAVCLRCFSPLQKFRCAYVKATAVCRSAPGECGESLTGKTGVKPRTATATLSSSRPGRSA